MKFKDVTKNIEGVFYYRNKSTRSFRAVYCDKQKNFSLKKYGAREALQKAVNWRTEMIEKYGEPTGHINNKTKLSFKNEYEIKENYFVLSIIYKPSGKSAKIKLSMEDLDLIQNHYWYFNPNEPENITSIRTYYKKKERFMTSMLFPDKPADLKINHINKDRFDFRRENITFEKGTIYRRPEKYKQSKETIPGVYYTEKDTKSGRYKYWRACYNKGDYNKQKSYNIDKYGYEEAKRLAKEKRKEWEKKLG